MGTAIRENGLVAGGSKPTRRSACAAIVASLVVAACGGSSHPAATATGVAGPSEVSAVPVSTAGANPFTPAVGKDSAAIKPPPAAASTTGGPATYTADLPGLYGGTRNYATCDAQKLISFLESNPAKAAAWASTLGIQPSDIRSYVGQLTAVTLRTDTRVTNHGFVNGLANPIQSVLEAGTAVFVNRYGQPVVKCYCGNPLTPPVLLASPTYIGPLWTGFAPTGVTIINQSITIIQVFKLYDPTTGAIFTRPAGTSGTRDGTPSTGTQTATTPTTTATTPTTAITPPVQPAPTQAPAPTPAPTRTQAPATQPPPTPTQTTPPAPARNPAASFSPMSGTVTDTYTIYVTGFRGNATLSMALTRPDGGVEQYSVSTDSSGNGSYTFPRVNNPAPGTYNAVVSDGATGDSASASTTVSP